jgi:sec-independent protein translocase protein TatA
MIGLPEILIVLVIVLLFFGYKKLPQLGRSAGEGVKTGIGKAKELSTTVGDKVDGKVDPQNIGRQAGKGLREAREFRDALTGKESPKPAAAPAKAAEATEPAAAAGAAPPPEPAEPAEPETKS